jgi:uncharacterized protein
VSREDAAIARRNYELLNEAYRSGDYAAFAEEAFDPDAVLVAGVNFPEQGEWRGVEGIERFIANQAEAFSEMWIRAEEIIDTGERIVVAARFGGVARQSGIPIEFTVFHVWTPRDGKVLRGEMFGTREEAMNAAGAAG